LILTAVATVVTKKLQKRRKIWACFSDFPPYLA
jgi:hypothetical protein